ncbi:MAG: ankyrin repeat-containing protein [Labilithrix sp.]|nr:ankyrin repeat-containing protein [Labilithrix sp.]
MSRDSAAAKIAVVVGIGAVAFGIATLRARIAGDKPKPDRVQIVTAATGAPGVTGAAPAEAATAENPRTPLGPTRADRIQLMEACLEGDQAKVEALVLKGVNLDGSLGSAAKSGNASLVGWLIAHGVSAKEDEDLTVPPILVADEHDAVVTMLLAKGAHEPTLAKAVAVGAPKAVARLLAKGASATSKTAEGEPVLMLAIRDTAGAKRRVIVDALLKAGADASTKYDDDTPLSIALASAVARTEDTEKAGDRAVDLVGKLVAKGAKVDGDALVAAMGAEEDKRTALLDVLLAGTVERSATLRGVTYAADTHDAASMKKLAAKGIAWPLLDPKATPPLANAIVGSDVAMVKALLDAGAPMDRMGEDGDTALLAAVAAAAGDSDDSVRVVRVLLEHGASANKRGRDGRTALFAAAQQGSEALVTLLVSKGARVDDAVDGMTPIEAADARGHDGVVKLLKARGGKLKKAPID